MEGRVHVGTGAFARSPGEARPVLQLASASSDLRTLWEPSQLVSSLQFLSRAWEQSLHA